MNTTPWMDQIKDNYQSSISNFFILSGNIFDYAVPGYLFFNYLKKSLKEDLGFSQILTLNPSYNFSSGETDSPMEAIKPLLNNKTKTAVIIKFPEFIFPNDEATYNNSIDPRFFYTMYDALNHKDFILSQNILIFITESRHAINPKFFAGATRNILIDISFPNEAERLAMIEFVGKNRKPFKSEITNMEFARVTAGLTRLGIEDIILQAQAKGELKKKFILDRKEELIKKEYGEILEVMSSDKCSFSDFSGSEHLKKYHMDAIINPMKRGDKSIVPKGLLYTGPPGTGKTHFARCLAGEAGINFVELKMSKILDKYVGESEKKFDKAISCIKSIAPVGVFIDELDQVFNRGGHNTSRVDGSLFSMLLTVLSEADTRGEILWIAATNYPNKIDEALKRPGRLDKKIPFLLPEAEDIQSTVSLYIKKSNLKHKLKAGDIEEIASSLEGFTQAEIESVVIKATELAIRGQMKELRMEELRQAISYSKRVSNEKMREMIDLAIEECNDLELLPTNYRNEWQQNKEMDGQTRRIGFNIN